MGIYLNPGNEGFAEALRSEIYVDKTGLIQHTNRYVSTEQKFLSAGPGVLASPWRSGCWQPIIAVAAIPSRCLQG